jgi:hypothetical protein
MNYMNANAFSTTRIILTLKTLLKNRVVFYVDMITAVRVVNA